MKKDLFIVMKLSISFACKNPKNWGLKLLPDILKKKKLELFDKSNTVMLFIPTTSTKSFFILYVSFMYVGTVT